jgi:cell division protein FtsZ
VLINITGGPDMTLFEVDAAANRIREEVGGAEDVSDTNIIFGSTLNMELEGVIRVSVVATGIDAQGMHKQQASFINQISANVVEIPAEEPEMPVELSSLIEDEEDEAEPVMPEAEAPDFEEYKIVKSNVQEAHKAPENFVGVQAPKRDELVRKPSLFGRMWESLKGAENKGEEKEQEKKRELESVGSSDIYDVPAFLRRK